MEPRELLDAIVAACREGEAIVAAVLLREYGLCFRWFEERAREIDDAGFEERPFADMLDELALQIARGLDLHVATLCLATILNRPHPDMPRWGDSEPLEA